MKLECTLKRPSGTQVPIGNELYDFQPNEQGDHVCMVADKAHADILMATGAYVVYGKVASAQHAASQAKATAEQKKSEANEAMKLAKEAQAVADEALAAAEEEEARIADEVAVEEERERERNESIARAKQKLEDERQAKLDEERILQIMKENSDMNEDDARKELAKQKRDEAKK